jgi:hypothetical protein
MDDRKPRAKDDDVPIIGDYSEAQNARLGAESRSNGAPGSGSAAAPSTTPRPPPAGARPASGRPAGRDGSDAWLLDARDVERHARLRRQSANKARLGRMALRYGAIALVSAVAFGVYWNFDVLRHVTVEVPDLSSLLGSSSSGYASGRAIGGADGAEVSSSVVVGTAAPTSVGAAAPEPKPPIESAEGTAHAAPTVEAREAPAAARSAAETSATAESVAAAPAAVEQPPEPPPTPETFTFALPKVTVSEGDAAAAVLILRNGGKRGPSSVTWWTSDGTAKAGSDYVDLGRVVVKFAAGEQNHTIHIPIVGDSAVEGPESFYVNLTAGDDPSAEAEERVEVVIEDDD